MPVSTGLPPAVSVASSVNWVDQTRFDWHRLGTDEAEGARFAHVMRNFGFWFAFCSDCVCVCVCVFHDSVIASCVRSGHLQCVCL
jgi:hypothetical protein